MTLKTTPPKKATDALREAARIMDERGASRDTVEERSMEKIVQIFNMLTGLNLTESQGWFFMRCLKLVRESYPGFRPDDYLDGIAYAALHYESEVKANESNPRVPEPATVEIAGSKFDQEELIRRLREASVPPTRYTGSRVCRCGRLHGNGFEHCSLCEIELWSRNQDGVAGPRPHQVSDAPPPYIAVRDVRDQITSQTASVCSSTMATTPDGEC